MQPLKKFEPVLGPPERPDPWWTRLFAYTVITVLVTAVFVVAALFLSYYFLEYTGSGSGGQALTIQEHDAVTLRLMWAGGALGILASLAYCVMEELHYHDRLQGNVKR